MTKPPGSLSRGTLIVAILSIGLLASAFLLFFLQPWTNFGALIEGQPQPLIGFTEPVALGDIGRMMTSDELVFDVAFHDYGSLEVRLPPAEVAKRIHGPPLYRGAVLEQYENGRWSLGRERDPVASFPIAPDERRGILVQTIRIKPMDAKSGFGIGFPVAALDDSPEEDRRIFEFFLDRQSAEIIRRPSARRGALTYRVYSSLDGLPPRSTSPNADIRHKAYLDTLLRVPEAISPLRDFAAETVGARQPEPMRQRDAALALQRRLHDSADFTYSKDRPVSDPKFDPIVEFVRDRKSGQCDDYASAMTIMLRSLSIPARMISGFKGGEYNAKSERYEVRGRHAHAWVEAYVDDSWQTFDPTPGPAHAGS